MRPLLVDFFCKAGGAAMGYYRAGFRVVGVDIDPQPNYPFEFIQGDALEVLEEMADGTSAFSGVEAIHASPPCQHASSLRHLSPDKEYPNLIPPTRELLERIGKPYIIENVQGADLRDPIRLCGSSFGLRIRRHRLFEVSGFRPVLVPPCAHHWQQDRIYPALNGEDRKRGGRSGIMGVYGNGGDKRADLWPEAMGIGWMTRDELTQAIPPAYTEWIGRELMSSVVA